jgi:hypothetical protein
MLDAFQTGGSSPPAKTAHPSKPDRAPLDALLAEHYLTPPVPGHTTQLSGLPSHIKHRLRLATPNDSVRIAVEYQMTQARLAKYSRYNQSALGRDRVDKYRCTVKGILARERAALNVHRSRTYATLVRLGGEDELTDALARLSAARGAHEAHEARQRFLASIDAYVERLLDGERA